MPRKPVGWDYDRPMAPPKPATPATPTTMLTVAPPAPKVKGRPRKRAGVDTTTITTTTELVELIRGSVDSEELRLRTNFPAVMKAWEEVEVILFRLQFEINRAAMEALETRRPDIEKAFNEYQMRLKLSRKAK
jgi:hypothetical protein